MAIKSLCLYTLLREVGVFSLSMKYYMNFLCSNNYDTPGPGVSEDEEQKIGLLRYFIVIGRHFWDLGILNVVYFFASIPAIVAYFFVACFALPDSGEIISKLSFELAVCLGIVLPAFLGNGPVRMGMCYVLRNYSREVHAFMWSDMWEYTKRYWKRGMVFSLINIAFVFTLCLDVRFYFELARSGDFFGLMSIYLAIFIFLIYMVFNSYFFMLTVTFEFGVKETIRKAFALAMGKIFQNLACVIVCMVFAALVLWVMVSFPIMMFLQLLVGYSYIMLLLDMNSFSVVKKYMAKEEEEKYEEE